MDIEKYIQDVKTRITELLEKFRPFLVEGVYDGWLPPRTLVFFDDSKDLHVTYERFGVASLGIQLVLTDIKEHAPETAQIDQKIQDIQKIHNAMHALDTNISSLSD